MNFVALIALRELRDRLRSGWIAACLCGWLALITLTSILGLVQIGQIGAQGYERTAVSLLNLVQYLVPLLGLLVGHDLVVRERDERTLHLLIATGLSRVQVLTGKLLGGAIAVAGPVLGGFLIAGGIIGMAARDAGFAPFIKLALTGTALAVAFCGIGLLVSAFSRTRVQALVMALLAWGMAVFAFDLAALGVIVTTRSAPASVEIDAICDTTHVNPQADIHSSYDASTPTIAPRRPEVSHLLSWVWLNPVDVFRVLNLPGKPAVPLPAGIAVLSFAGWTILSLGVAWRRFNRIDL